MSIVPLVTQCFTPPCIVCLGASAFLALRQRHLQNPIKKQMKKRIHISAAYAAVQLRVFLLHSLVHDPLSQHWPLEQSWFMSATNPGAFLHIGTTASLTWRTIMICNAGFFNSTRSRTLPTSSFIKAAEFTRFTAHIWCTPFPDSTRSCTMSYARVLTAAHFPNIAVLIFRTRFSNARPNTLLFPKTRPTYNKHNTKIQGFLCCPSHYFSWNFNLRISLSSKTWVTLRCKST